MEERYWGLCESCRNAVDTGPTIECGLNLAHCGNRHYEPMEDTNDESENERRKEGTLPF